MTGQAAEGRGENGEGSLATFDEAEDVGGEGAERWAAGALHHGGPRHPELRVASARRRGGRGRRKSFFWGEQGVFLGFLGLAPNREAAPRGGGGAWSLAGRAVEKAGCARVSAWSGPHTPTKLVRACNFNTKLE